MNFIKKMVKKKFEVLLSQNREKAVSLWMNKVYFGKSEYLDN
jgi:hypothetical protein